jgi:hypothetical protein
MILKEARPIIRRPVRGEPSSPGRDPANLSALLRELALESYQLVRQLNGTDADTESARRVHQQKLIEVHERIVALQRSLRLQHLDDLAAYVSALRQRLEQRLS